MRLYRAGRGGRPEHIDIHLAVQDESCAELNAHRRAFVSEFGEPLLIQEAPQNAPPGGGFQLVLYRGAAVLMTFVKLTASGQGAPPPGASRCSARKLATRSFPPRPPGYVLDRAITRPLASAVTAAMFGRSDPSQRPNRPISGAEPPAPKQSISRTSIGVLQIDRVPDMHHTRGHWHAIQPCSLVA